MSSRALRKLEKLGTKQKSSEPKNENRENKPAEATESVELFKNGEEENGGPSNGENSNHSDQEESLSKNPFDLLNDEDEIKSDDKLGSAEHNQSNRDERNSTKTEQHVAASTKKKKKNKKKKTKKPTVDENGFDEILQEFVAETEKIGAQNPSGDLFPNQSSSAMKKSPNFSGETELFRVEHRNLNPDTEMRRIFGSSISDPELRRMVSTNQRRAPKSRHVPTGGRLVHPKSNWAHFAATGLSMKQVESLADRATLFTFVHGQAYKEAQLMFWEAVDSMNPDAFLAILQHYPCHIDTLLQLSEVMRANEDAAGARDLIERAVFACEAAFHPRFNVTQYNCRLDYNQQENRPCFIALFRHMSFLANRGCNRTALEFCKLIYGLNPEQDPLGMLLIIDFLAVKSNQFDYLLALYRGLEASKNLSLLPNFVYSAALGMFRKFQEMPAEAEVNLKIADELLQDALVKFPTMLMPILDKCSVEPDKEVTACEIFGPLEQISDSSGLKQLMSLYIARTGDLWKEPDVIGWLERNVKEVIGRLRTDSNKKRITCVLEEYRKIRRTRYQGTPRNILRHILISELKDATLALPPELRDAPILSYDPLPPLESKCNYERPKKVRRPLNDGLLGGFLRSLMPNYDPDAAAIAQALQEDAQVEGAVGGDEAANPGNDLQHSVRNLLVAMRDLLNNVEVQGPQREDGGPGRREDENGERDDNDEWDMG